MILNYTVYTVNFVCRFINLPSCRKCTGKALLRIDCKVFLDISPLTTCDLQKRKRKNRINKLLYGIPNSMKYINKIYIKSK